MKKFIFLFCSLGAIISCSRNYVDIETAPDDFQVINEQVEGSRPVSFRINGNVLATKGTSDMPLESYLANVRMSMTGCNSAGNLIYSESFELGNSTDFIVNVKQCESVKFSIKCGEFDGENYLTALEHQSEYLYAEGNKELTWSEIENQTAPYEITLTRKINKITIDRIAVAWKEDVNKSKEFIIKRIFLSDVPREYVSANDFITLYSSRYTKEKEGLKYYNLLGMEDYSYHESVTDDDYYPVLGRLDDQLVDEVNVRVSEDSPYTTPHVFYTYLGTSQYVFPEFRNAVDRSNGFITVFPAMSTIAIEAEMDGIPMFYRFQISSGTPPKNTHFKFSELLITELGAPTLLESKTYRNLAYKMEDWSENNVSDSVESL